MDCVSENRDFEDDDDDPSLEVTEETYLIRKGKYKGLSGPKLNGVKPQYRDRVNQLKEEIEQDPDFKRYASWLAREYSSIRREKDEKEAELSEINLRLLAVTELMAEQYDIESTSILSLDNGDKIEVRPEPKATVTDPVRYQEWGIKNGLLSLMKIPWATTNKMAKDMAYEGEDAPPGVTVGINMKVIYTKGKK